MIAQASKAQVWFWVEKARHRLGAASPIPDPSAWHESVRLHVFADRAAYCDHRAQLHAEYAERKRLLQELASGGSRVDTEAFCIACHKRRVFRTAAVAHGGGPGADLNWREGLICRRCGLNSRMRASIHLLFWAIAPGHIIVFT